MYTGKQIGAPGSDMSGNLGALSLGKKEMTGHTENNQSYTRQPVSNVDNDQFKTIYNGTYRRQNPRSTTEYPRINDESAMDLQGNGFTKSEKLHQTCDKGNLYDEGRQLKFLHPYVNRSLKARDPFYGETKYAHKSTKAPLLLT